MINLTISKYEGRFKVEDISYIALEYHIAGGNEYTEEYQFESYSIENETAKFYLCEEDEPFCVVRFDCMVLNGTRYNEA
ncbi:hypothetical protein IX51_03875 [uncultured archaeon]|nr:hypothetical protein IX51_03875 [uncultured archaeon]